MIMAQSNLIKFVFFIFLVLPQTKAFAEDCGKAVESMNKGVARPEGSKEAEQLFREALFHCPSLGDASYNLGQNFLKQGRLNDAKVSFERAIKTKKEAEYLLALANVFVLMGDLDKAQEQYRRVLDDDQSDARAQQGLSAVYFRKNDYARAEEVLRNAIQSSPNNGDLFYNLGVTLVALGRPAEAISSFQAAWEKNPELAKAAVRLAKAYLENGETKEAERVARQAAEKFPNEIDAWLVLATVEDAEKRYPEALSALDRAYRLNDKHLQVLVNQGIISAKMGKFDEALQKLNGALALFPAEPAVQSSLGWVLLQQKNLDEAEKRLRAAIELDARDAFAYNNLGVLFELRGNKEQAREYYRRAKDADAKLSEAENNLRRIAE